MCYPMSLEYPELMKDALLFCSSALRYILEKDYFYFLVNFIYFTHCREQTKSVHIFLNHKYSELNILN